MLRQIALPQLIRRFACAARLSYLCTSQVVHTSSHFIPASTASAPAWSLRPQPSSAVTSADPLAALRQSVAAVLHAAPEWPHDESDHSHQFISQNPVLDVSVVDFFSSVNNATLQLTLARQFAALPAYGTAHVQHADSPIAHINAAQFAMISGRQSDARDIMFRAAGKFPTHSALYTSWAELELRASGAAAPHIRLGSSISALDAISSIDQYFDEHYSSSAGPARATLCVLWAQLLLSFAHTMSRADAEQLSLVERARGLLQRACLQDPACELYHLALIRFLRAQGTAPSAMVSVVDEALQSTVRDGCASMQLLLERVYLLVNAHATSPALLAKLTHTPSVLFNDAMGCDETDISDRAHVLRSADALMQSIAAHFRRFQSDSAKPVPDSSAFWSQWSWISSQLGQDAVSGQRKALACVCTDSTPTEWLKLARQLLDQQVKAKPIDLKSDQFHLEITQKLCALSKQNSGSLSDVDLSSLLSLALHRCVQDLDSPSIVDAIELHFRAASSVSSTKPALLRVVQLLCSFALHLNLDSSRVKRTLHTLHTDSAQTLSLLIKARRMLLLLVDQSNGAEHTLRALKIAERRVLESKLNADANAGDEHQRLWKNVERYCAVLATLVSQRDPALRGALDKIDAAIGLQGSGCWSLLLGTRASEDLMTQLETELLTAPGSSSRQSHAQAGRAFYRLSPTQRIAQLDIFALAMQLCDRQLQASTCFMSRSWLLKYRHGLLHWAHLAMARKSALTSLFVQERLSCLRDALSANPLAKSVRHHLADLIQGHLDAFPHCQWAVACLLHDEVTLRRIWLDEIDTGSSLAKSVLAIQSDSTTQKVLAWRSQTPQPTAAQLHSLVHSQSAALVPLIVQSTCSIRAAGDSRGLISDLAAHRADLLALWPAPVFGDSV